MNRRKVVVIGGGVVGLCTAYYLLQEGHQVTVIDKGKLETGASYVNAGYLTPSHIIPMAAPGMLAKGFQWMFNSSSPFYIKPRLDGDLFRWGLKFIKSCTHAHVQQSMQAILDINILSKQLYLEMQKKGAFDFHLETKGLLMAYKTTEAEKEEAEVVSKAQDLGLTVNQLSREEILKMQPEAPMDIAGAFWYESDAHSTPELFMKNLLAYLKKEGVEVILENEVKQIKTKGSIIQSIQTTQQEIALDELVIAAGAWSATLLRSLGIRLTLQAGKGYRLNLNQPSGINLPAILIESKVAVTPMKGFTRFGGTMELSGINHTINKKRVNAIAEAAKNYYPHLKIPEEVYTHVNCGLRPLSHDGLPYIGRYPQFSNLVLAAGHAMMGWSLGPATGKLVSELISQQQPTLSLTPFAPER